MIGVLKNEDNPSQYPRKSKEAERIIVRAIRIAQIYKRKRATRYVCGENLSLETDQVKMPAGRPDEGVIRIIVFSAFYHAWIIAFGKIPKVNNTMDHSTPFVVFLESILIHLDMGKFEDHLVEYRSFQKASEVGLWYPEWKAAKKGRTLDLLIAKRKARLKMEKKDLSYFRVSKSK